LAAFLFTINQTIHFSEFCKLFWQISICLPILHSLHYWG